VPIEQQQDFEALLQQAQQPGRVRQEPAIPSLDNSELQTDADDANQTATYKPLNALSSLGSIESDGVRRMVAELTSPVGNSNQDGEVSGVDRHR
jgi:hypothetical protein